MIHIRLVRHGDLRRLVRVRPKGVALMAHLFLCLQTTLHGRIKAVANISHWQGGHLQSDRDSTSFSLGRDETSVCVRAV